LGRLRPTRLELISIHLPKTAGWSFRAALDAEYGDDLWAVYHDEPGNARDYRAVHGHFRPARFWSAGRNARLVMWMRDPVERIRSWYDYWDAAAPSGERDHEAFRAADMSLAEFAAWDVVTGQFEHVFLDGTSGLDDFDFIGFTEHFEEDLHRLAGRLQWRTTPSVVTANRTPKPPSTVDDATRAAIHEHHAFEVDFYNRALERRAAAL